ncbi:MAG: glycoside hydrolase family 27 protein [Treponema sp.]|nr:glycoside hydrolase family 27 protein [Treponema sp.]
MDAINIKNEDYRYDSFDNGKVMPFLEGKEKGLPAMGWNSWNAFGSANTEELTKIMADKFIELDLDKLGYKYIILDDGCYKPARVDGKLSNEPVKFPSGFKALSDYIHGKGLKFGMYNDIGTNLCAGAAVGTCGHEDVDAASYMEWGVDFLKVDNCYYLWDNATFSDAKNARYVYTPNIRGIKVEGTGLPGSEKKRPGRIEFLSTKNGTITGNGPRLEGDFVTNIGTFDGTGPEQTPVGMESGELHFDVTVPSGGEYKLYVNYASGEEPGCGQWLQVAVSSPAAAPAPAGAQDAVVGSAGAHDAGSNSEPTVTSTLFFDGFLPATESKASFTESEAITIILKEGKNTIRLMNHRRQENTLSSYAKLLEEINKIKPDNDLVFSTCEWGKTQPQNWAYKVANSWRILNDITFQVGAPGNPGKGNWVDGYTPSVTSQYNKAVIMDEFAGLDKGWNDPDMLMIGMDGLTPEMNRTHFAMWCMMNSPLMLGMDLRRVQKGDWMYNIIANEKLIALNQDILGIQAKRIKALYKKGSGMVKVENPSTAYSRNNDRLDILAKPLYDGSIAVSFINLSQTETYENLKVSMKEIMDAIGHKMPVRPDYVNLQSLIVENLWTGEKSEIKWTSDDELTGIRLSSGILKPCDNLTVRIYPAEQIDRRHVAASVHQYLLESIGEKDEENWDAAKELKDLYDCRVCVTHIAQMYVKGIMPALLPDDKIWGTREPVDSDELKEIVLRVINR